jgi:hypothetical protein
MVGLSFAFESINRSSLRPLDRIIASLFPSNRLVPERDERPSIEETSSSGNAIGIVVTMNPPSLALRKGER